MSDSPRLNIVVKVQIERARKQLKRLRDEMQAVSDMQINVKASTEPARRKIEKLKKDIPRSMTIDIDPRIDKNQFKKELTNAKRQAEKTVGSVKVPVELKFLKKEANRVVKQEINPALEKANPAVAVSLKVKRESLASFKKQLSSDLSKIRGTVSITPLLNRTSLKTFKSELQSKLKGLNISAKLKVVPQFSSSDVREILSKIEKKFQSEQRPLNLKVKLSLDKNSTSQDFSKFREDIRKMAEKQDAKIKLSLEMNEVYAKRFMDGLFSDLQRYAQQKTLAIPVEAQIVGLVDTRDEARSKKVEQGTQTKNIRDESTRQRNQSLTKAVSQVSKSADVLSAASNRSPENTASSTNISQAISRAGRVQADAIDNMSTTLKSSLSELANKMFSEGGIKRDRKKETDRIGRLRPAYKEAANQVGRNTDKEQTQMILKALQSTLRRPSASSSNDGVRLEQEIVKAFREGQRVDVRAQTEAVREGLQPVIKMVDTVAAKFGIDSKFVSDMQNQTRGLPKGQVQAAQVKILQDKIRAEGGDPKQLAIMFAKELAKLGRIIQQNRIGGEMVFARKVDSEIGQYSSIDRNVFSRVLFDAVRNMPEMFTSVDAKGRRRPEEGFNEGRRVMGGALRGFDTLGEEGEELVVSILENLLGINTVVETKAASVRASIESNTATRALETIDNVKPEVDQAARLVESEPAQMAFNFDEKAVKQSEEILENSRERVALAEKVVNSESRVKRLVEQQATIIDENTAKQIQASKIVATNTQKAAQSISQASDVLNSISPMSSAGGGGGSFVPPPGEFDGPGGGGPPDDGFGSFGGGGGDDGGMAKSLRDAIDKLRIIIQKRGEGVTGGTVGSVEDLAAFRNQATQISSTAQTQGNVINKALEKAAIENNIEASQIGPLLDELQDVQREADQIAGNFKLVAEQIQKSNSEVRAFDKSLKEADRASKNVAVAGRALQEEFKNANLENRSVDLKFVRDLEKADQQAKKAYSKLRVTFQNITEAFDKAQADLAAQGIDVDFSPLLLQYTKQFQEAEKIIEKGGRKVSESVASVLNQNLAFLGSPADLDQLKTFQKQVADVMKTDAFKSSSIEQRTNIESIKKSLDELVTSAQKVRKLGEAFSSSEGRVAEFKEELERLIKTPINELTDADFKNITQLQKGLEREQRKLNSEFSKFAEIKDRIKEELKAKGVVEVDLEPLAESLAVDMARKFNSEINELLSKARQYVGVRGGEQAGGINSSQDSYGLERGMDEKSTEKNLQNLSMNIENLRRLTEKMRNGFSLSEGETQKYANSINFLETNLKKVQRALQALENEAKSSGNEELLKVVQRLNSEYGQQINLGNQLLQTSKQLRDQNQAVNKTFRGLQGGIEGVSDKLAKAIIDNSLFASSFAVIFGLSTAIRTSVQDFVELEKQIARVIVVSESVSTTNSQLAEIVGKELVEASNRFGVSYEQSAQVLKEYGSAGVQAEVALSAFESTLRLVIATEAEAGEVTRTVAGIYEVLGDTINVVGGQLGKIDRINNVLTRAFKDSQLELQELVQGFKFSSAAARNVGVSFEDLTSLLGVLNNNLIKSGTAGRSLQVIFSQIATKSNDFAKAFGIAIDPDQPIQFIDLLEQVSQKIDQGALSAQRIEEVFNIFGLRGARSFFVLAQQFEEVERFQNSLARNADGSLDAVSSQVSDTIGVRLQALLRTFQTSFSTTLIDIFGGEKGLNRIKNVLDFAAKSIEFIFEALAGQSDFPFLNALGELSKLLIMITSIRTLNALFQTLGTSLNKATSGLKIFLDAGLRGANEIGSGTSLSKRFSDYFKGTAEAARKAYNDSIESSLSRVNLDRNRENIGKAEEAASGASQAVETAQTDANTQANKANTQSLNENTIKEAENANAKARSATANISEANTEKAATNATNANTSAQAANSAAVKTSITGWMRFKGVMATVRVGITAVSSAMLNLVSWIGIAASVLSLFGVDLLGLGGVLDRNQERNLAEIGQRRQEILEDIKTYEEVIDQLQEIEKDRIQVNFNTDELASQIRRVTDEYGSAIMSLSQVAGMANNNLVDNLDNTINALQIQRRELERANREAAEAEAEMLITRGSGDEERSIYELFEQALEAGQRGDTQNFNLLSSEFRREVSNIIEKLTAAEGGDSEAALRSFIDRIEGPLRTQFGINTEQVLDVINQSSYFEREFGPAAEQVSEAFRELSSATTELNSSQEAFSQSLRDVGFSERAITQITSARSADDLSGLGFNRLARQRSSTLDILENVQNRRSDFDPNIIMSEVGAWGEAVINIVEELKALASASGQDISNISPSDVEALIEMAASSDVTGERQIRRVMDQIGLLNNPGFVRDLILESESEEGLTVRGSDFINILQQQRRELLERGRRSESTAERVEIASALSGIDLRLERLEILRRLVGEGIEVQNLLDLGNIMRSDEDFLPRQIFGTLGKDLSNPSGGEYTRDLDPRFLGERFDVLGSMLSSDLQRALRMMTVGDLGGGITLGNISQEFRDAGYTIVEDLSNITDRFNAGRVEMFSSLNAQGEFAGLDEFVARGQELDARLSAAAENMANLQPLLDISEELQQNFDDLEAIDFSNLADQGEFDNLLSTMREIVPILSRLDQDGDGITEFSAPITESALNIAERYQTVLDRITEARNTPFSVAFGIMPEFTIDDFDSIEEAAQDLNDKIRNEFLDNLAGDGDSPFLDIDLGQELRDSTMANVQELLRTENAFGIESLSIEGLAFDLADVAFEGLDMTEAGARRAAQSLYNRFEDELNIAFNREDRVYTIGGLEFKEEDLNVTTFRQFVKAGIGQALESSGGIAEAAILDIVPALSVAFTQGVNNEDLSKMVITASQLNEKFQNTIRILTVQRRIMEDLQETLSQNLEYSLNQNAATREQNALLYNQLQQIRTITGASSSRESMENLAGIRAQLQMELEEARQKGESAQSEEGQANIRVLQERIALITQTIDSQRQMARQAAQNNKRIRADLQGTLQQFTASVRSMRMAAFGGAGEEINTRQRLTDLAQELSEQLESVAVSDGNVLEMGTAIVENLEEQLDIYTELAEMRRESANQAQSELETFTQASFPQSEYISSANSFREATRELIDLTDQFGRLQSQISAAQANGAQNLGGLLSDEQNLRTEIAQATLRTVEAQSEMLRSEEELLQFVDKRLESTSKIIEILEGLATTQRDALSEIFNFDAERAFRGVGDTIASLLDQDSTSFVPNDQIDRLLNASRDINLSFENTSGLVSDIVQDFENLQDRQARYEREQNRLQIQRLNFYQSTFNRAVEASDLRTAETQLDNIVSLAGELSESAPEFAISTLERVSSQYQALASQGGAGGPASQIQAVNELLGLTGDRLSEITDITDEIIARSLADIFQRQADTLGAFTSELGAASDGVDSLRESFIGLFSSMTGQTDVGEVLARATASTYDLRSGSGTGLQSDLDGWLDSVGAAIDNIEDGEFLAPLFQSISSGINEDDFIRIGSLYGENIVDAFSDELNNLTLSSLNDTINEAIGLIDQSLLENTQALEDADSDDERNSLTERISGLEAVREQYLETTREIERQAAASGELAESQRRSVAVMNTLVAAQARLSQVETIGTDSFSPRSDVFNPAVAYANQFDQRLELGGGAGLDFDLDGLAQQLNEQAEMQIREVMVGLRTAYLESATQRAIERFTTIANDFTNNLGERFGAVLSNISIGNMQQEIKNALDAVMGVFDSVLFGAFDILGQLSAEKTDETTDNVETVENQVAALEKQLRRNQISYVDYLNSIEDLQSEQSPTDNDPRAEGQDFASQFIQGIGEAFSSLGEGFLSNLKTQLTDFAASETSEGILSRVLFGQSLGRGRNQALDQLLENAERQIQGIQDRLGLSGDNSQMEQLGRGVESAVRDAGTTVERGLSEVASAVNSLPQRMDSVLSSAVSGESTASSGGVTEAIASARETVERGVGAGDVEAILAEIAPPARSLEEAAQSLEDSSGIIRSWQDRGEPSAADPLKLSRDDIGNDTDATFIEKFKTGLVGALKTAFSVATSFVGQILQFASVDFGSITEQFVGIIQDLPEQISELVNSLIDNIPIIVDAIVESLPGIVESIFGKLGDLVTVMIDGLVELIPSIVEQIPFILEGIIEGIVAVISRIGEIVTTLVTSVVQMLPHLVTSLVMGIGDIISGLITAALELVGTAIPNLIAEVLSPNFWKNLIGGILKGVVNLVKGIGKGILNGFKAIGKGFKKLFDRDKKDEENSTQNFYRDDQIGATRGNTDRRVEYFHEGGLVTGSSYNYNASNLKPDEVPAVLQVGEAVISKSAVGLLGGARVVESLNNGTPITSILRDRTPSSDMTDYVSRIAPQLNIPAIRLLTQATGGSSTMLGLGALLSGKLHGGGSVTNEYTDAEYNEMFGQAYGADVNDLNLAPNEVPVILQQGEGVLTADGLRLLGGSPILNAINSNVALSDISSLKTAATLEAIGYSETRRRALSTLDTAGMARLHNFWGRSNGEILLNSLPSSVEDAVTSVSAERGINIIKDYETSLKDDIGLQEWASRNPEIEEVYGSGAKVSDIIRGLTAHITLERTKDMSIGEWVQDTAESLQNVENLKGFSKLMRDAGFKTEDVGISTVEAIGSGGNISDIYETVAMARQAGFDESLLDTNFTAEVPGLEDVEAARAAWREARHEMGVRVVAGALSGGSLGAMAGAGISREDVKEARKAYELTQDTALQAKIIEEFSPILSDLQSKITKDRAQYGGGATAATVDKPQNKVGVYHSGGVIGGSSSGTSGGISIPNVSLPSPSTLKSAQSYSTPISNALSRLSGNTDAPSFAPTFKTYSLNNSKGTTPTTFNLKSEGGVTRQTSQNNVFSPQITINASGSQSTEDLRREFEAMMAKQMEEFMKRVKNKSSDEYKNFEDK